MNNIKVYLNDGKKDLTIDIIKNGNKVWHSNLECMNIKNNVFLLFLVMFYNSGIDVRACLLCKPEWVK